MVVDGFRCRLDVPAAWASLPLPPDRPSTPGVLFPGVKSSAPGRGLRPEDRHYVIDYHHLARAQHDEGVEDVLVTVVKNLRTLDFRGSIFDAERRMTHGRSG
jgi:hypothetical protein